MNVSVAKCILVLLLSWWSTSVVETCIHDSLDHKYVTGTQNYDDRHPFQARDQARILADSSPTYQSIRITPYYDDVSLNKLPVATRAELFKFVGAAIQRLSATLQVVPVSGNLFAERYCTRVFATTPPVCNSIATNETCLEMPMPDDHFAPLKTCNRCSSNGCMNCKVSPAGAGIPDTDFLIYLRAEDTDRCKSGSTLAYASTCQQDQYDRPTFGMVNFCPNGLSTATSAFERQVSTALHEFTHALGFSSRFFALMRYEDGTPRTPRDGKGNPPAHSSGTCPNGNNVTYYVEPSSTTIKYSTERNHVVAKMVTPRVRSFVQEHFNCSTLEGAEIESQDDGCLGSHWEERLFEPEYMTPITSYRNVFSALTLAFFADSGWYQVDPSASEVMHFGRNKGCTFVTEKCLDPATQAPLTLDHFCATPATEFQGCSIDATSRAVCSLSTKRLVIPTEYQYFPGMAAKGGSNSYADFCPLVVGYTGGDCSISRNLLKLGTSSINAFGETYCPTCKCTATSLRSTDSLQWAISVPRRSGCYAMRCFVDDNSITASFVVELTIPRSKTQDNVRLKCTKPGQKFAVPGFRGDITCPDPVVVCGVNELRRNLLADTNDNNNVLQGDGPSNLNWSSNTNGIDEVPSDAMMTRPRITSSTNDRHRASFLLLS